MRATALLAREAGDDHALGELEQKPELERLGEIAVEDRPLVLDVDVRVALAEAGDDLALARHLLLAAEDAEVLVHGRRQLVADLPGPLAGRAIEEVRQLPFGVALDRLRHLDRRVRERPLGSVPARALPERDRLHKRISAEAVG